MSLTDEQLRLRRSGISGSDISAILGLNPWRRPIDVQMDKLGQGPPRKPSTVRQLKGQRREPELLGDYAERHQVRIVQPGTLVHPSESWVRGTPDGMAFDLSTPDTSDPRLAVEGVEAKVVGARLAHSWGEPGTDEVPPYVHLQCDWYMYLTDRSRWTVVAEIDLEDYEYPIERDRELESNMVERAHDFWRRHVSEAQPIDPDGSLAYSRYLKDRFPANHLDLVRADTKTAALVRAFYEIKQRLIKLENEEAQYVQAIKLAIGAHSGIEFNAVSPSKSALQKITWKRCKDTITTDWETIAKAFRARLINSCTAAADAEKLRAECDEVIAKTRKVTKKGSRRFNVPRNFNKPEEDD